MKLCFNQATTMVKSSLELDLQFCEKHGYDLIEIRTMDKLKDYLKNHSIEDLANYFKTHKIKPYAFNALVFFNNRDEAGYKEIKEELQYMCKVGQKIGCPNIVVVPLVGTDKFTYAQIKESSVKVLHELADIAEKYSIRLAIEFVGHPQCTINTFGQAYDIVQAVNRNNVGLVLDCFHFHAMGSRMEDLKKADGSKIFILHIDDTEDFPIGILTDVDRVWPGEGAIDLKGILTTLKEIGYKEDMVSVELFRPEYYELEVEEAIKIAKEKTLAVVGKYF
ncbi:MULTISPECIES: sugar phosphate isomerase/epimerase family protein [Pelosinus]|uniref:Xylose isomerase domain-containing protein TIM barrel n=1 Tax=Pelosinus fermentans B4 TaxID=1149862 RepID=I9B5U7_9FIRM|nr:MULTISPECIES: sugar phosphate isomerase/epimerase [Pelosinus]EIW20497.1 Xylose isomerase domain-containing protein TIM barrel [Pelosinus fermentans B4]EIW25788.1 Xylose isomerase domain-containing protein TIM barrel [Pelosinus fermentans A11]OAM93512.1 Xylose isomerase domain-containing protein TIM barrel [Pelosinus fermentans DSM 17108]SDQ80416.1 2-keto-myo-inositol isomerase [Pelosinus fermentans]